MKVVRKGTSYLDFEAAFPNDAACLDHILRRRGGEVPICTRCHKRYKLGTRHGSYRFVSSCGCDETYNPLSGTMFERSRIPLTDWFRCMLYFTNTSSGISAAFVQRQFGISYKAAVAMCRKVRKHLCELDRGIVLAPEGGTVFVDEVTLKSIIVRGGQKGRAFRLLIATDGTEYAAVPIERGRYAGSRKTFTDLCGPNASLEVRRPETLRKILNFKGFSRLYGRAINLTGCPERKEFLVLSVFAMKLKQFILHSHIWVSSSFFDDYIGHFGFLYRRRASGDQAFWDAVSHFPRP